MNSPVDQAPWLVPFILFFLSTCAAALNATAVLLGDLVVEQEMLQEF